MLELPTISDMALMAILQWIDPSDDFIKMNTVGLETQMRYDVYKGVSLSLLDGVVRFVLETGKRNIVSWTRFSHVLSHVAVLLSSEINCAWSDCPCWYHFQYHAADLRELLPKHRGCCNYPGLMSQACEGDNIWNVFYIKAMFLEEHEKAQVWLVKQLPTPVEESSQVNPSVGEKASSVVAENMGLHIEQPGSSREDAEKGHWIDSRRCREG